MHVEVTAATPGVVGADLLAVAPGPRAEELGAPERAVAEADPVAIVHRDSGPPLAVIAHTADPDGLRAAATRAVGAARAGETVAWALDPLLPVPAAAQARALAEGAVLGGYDHRRWRSSGPAATPERFVICGAGEELAPVAERAARVASWTNRAREMVDAPPNLMSPSDLEEHAAALPGVQVEVVRPEDAGLGALAAVGAGSLDPPRLIVVRHAPPGNAGGSGGARAGRPCLALVGKAVTFDSGGYFLKPRSDIVRQKADMAGGAAVLAALGAIAELGLPLSVIGLVPACESMVGPRAMRPTDVIRTAAGLTVEVVNPDAEGRLILADAMWYARRQGATHLVDLATLTGAMREGMGDVYAGVFAHDAAWREAVVAAGNASGDPAWPWPLHSRYRALIDSSVADLRNSANTGFGYPIVAATFLAQFAGEGPWAHVDMLGPALLDDDRGDGLGPGASGYGVRLLVELATRLCGQATP